jgi:hypothetical protein
MKNTFSMKNEINGLLISTVKIGKVYETMVLDRFGNELETFTTNYKNEAKHNHFICVTKYVNQRNCIHIVR